MPASAALGTSARRSVKNASTTPTTSAATRLGTWVRLRAQLIAAVRETLLPVTIEPVNPAATSAALAGPGPPTTSREEVNSANTTSGTRAA